MSLLSAVRNSRRSALTLLCAALLAALLPLSVAEADTTALTDDKSVATKTGYWAYGNETIANISSKLSANQARLTDIEVNDAANGRFSAVMVRNSGAYAVPGWWWYVNQTAAQVSSKLSANSARLIDIEAYSTSSGIRFAVVMVSNTGAANRAWTWLVGVSTSQISTHLSNNNGRLIDLEQYVEGGVTRYAVIAVSNTGADAKAWQYWYGQTSSEVNSRLSAFGGRLTSIERRPDGTYNIIMVKNAGSDAFAWWWYTNFTSVTAVVNRAAQLGARVVDMETYTVNASGLTLRRYSAVFIDNSNASERRLRGVFAARFFNSSGTPIGSFGTYLKRVGSTTVTNFNGGAVIDPASAIKALHHVTAMRRVDAGNDTLTSGFVYYDYPNSPYNAGTKDACPVASDETTANKRTDWNLGQGLQAMMVPSDNRATRGVELRYGRATLNNTASTIGMSQTVIRQNPGCGYDDGLKNSSTMVDLGRLYEGVQNASLLSSTGRTQFFARMAGGGVDSGIVAIINDEAAKLGKSGIASQFANNSNWRVKGGSYNICHGEDTCSWTITRTEAGRLTLPFKARGTIVPTHFVFGSFMADTPVSCPSCSDSINFQNTYGKASDEVFREEIRRALKTW